MRKFILMLVLITCFSDFKSQNVGISTTGSAPRDCAMLDIVSSTKGLLIPNLALTSNTVYAPATGAPVEGLLIYNNGSGVSPKGFYFWNSNTSTGSWDLLCICSGTNVGGGTKVVSKENTQELNSNLNFISKQESDAENLGKSSETLNSSLNIYPLSVPKDLMFNGSVKFVNGVAEVLFDSEFKELCDLNTLVITASPLGNCKGIYIYEINDKVFKIKELKKGKTNVKVNFIVSARLKLINFKKN